MIQILPFLNNPKDLDPSYKMDLDFWHCFGRKNLHLISEKIQDLFSNSLAQNLLLQTFDVSSQTSQYI